MTISRRLKSRSFLVGCVDGLNAPASLIAGWTYRPIASRPAAVSVADAWREVGRYIEVAITAHAAAASSPGKVEVGFPAADELRLVATDDAR